MNKLRALEGLVEKNKEDNTKYPPTEDKQLYRGHPERTREKEYKEQELLFLGETKEKSTRFASRSS